MKNFFLLLTALITAASSAQIVYMQDPAMQAYILGANATNNRAFIGNSAVAVDTNSDGNIQASEAAAITRLWIESPTIMSLAGVNNFTNLTRLDVKGIGATVISLPAMPNLQQIQFSQCPSVGSITLTGFSGLTQISATENPQLTQLNFPDSYNLVTVIVNDNALGSLQLNDRLDLLNVYASNNAITNFNVVGCASLQGINISNNQLTTLNVSNLPLLTNVLADNNPQMTTLNADNCTSLLYSTNITTSGNSLMYYLHFSGCTAMQQFTLHNTSMATLDLSGCSSLLSVNAANNQLTQIDLTGCSLLTDLDCSANSLTALDISDCPSLHDLVAFDNSLSDIDLQSGMQLETVRLENNALTTINASNLPNLSTLKLDVNYLDSFDTSNCPLLSDLSLGNNDQIVSVNISNCPLLGSLNVTSPLLNTVNLSGATGLSTLILSGNGPVAAPISSLTVSNLPSLTNFSVDYTSIQSLDLSGNALLQTVYIGNGPLTDLDVSALPALQNISLTNTTLATLDVSGSPNLSNVWLVNDNALLQIFAKNGANEFINFDGGAPNLEFVCQDDSALAQTQSDLNSNGLTNVTCNSYCSFTPGGNYNTITGTVRFDHDNNGCDASDMTHPNIRVDLNDGTTTAATFTNAPGAYVFYTDAGNFTLSPAIENPSFFTVSPTTANIPFADSNDNSVTQDFCIEANGVHNDAEIVIAPVTGAAPGFASWYVVTFKNKGNQVLNGTYTLSFDDAVLDFFLATMAPASQATGLLTWNYTDLLPFESRSLYIGFNVNSPTMTPPVNIGDVLGFTASINPMPGDETPADNQFTLNLTVVGSYDPNDIACLEGDVVAPSEIGNYLHYIVNFENTGTAEAQNIVVKIEVDPAKYDMDSLQLLSTSHPAFTRINGNLVEFIFEDINLGVAGDPPGGHGNVLFKIRSDDGLSQGDVVSGKADIFFDYNFPIETNEAETVFQQLSLPDTHSDASISVYPNPSAGLVNVSAASGIKSLELFDLHGRLLQKSLNSSSIDLSQRSSGLYFLRITTEAGFSVCKVSRR